MHKFIIQRYQQQGSGYRQCRYLHRAHGVACKIGHIYVSFFYIVILNPGIDSCLRKKEAVYRPPGYCESRVGAGTPHISISYYNILLSVYAFGHCRYVSGRISVILVSL